MRRRVTRLRRVLRPAVIGGCGFGAQNEDVFSEIQLYVSSNIVFNSYFLLIATTGTDLGENIRAEQADREHDQDERHDEVHQLGDHVANLEVRRADLDGQGRDTLARRRSRGEERHEDTVIQRLEESRHDTSEIKRRRQNDDVLRIEHLLIQLECFSSILFFFSRYRFVCSLHLSGLLRRH